MRWPPRAPREPRAICWAVEKNVMNELPKRHQPNQFSNMPRAVAFFAAFRTAGTCPRHVREAVPASAINLSLRMMWRRPANSAKQWQLPYSGSVFDVAGCVEFPVLPLHRLRARRRAVERLSGAAAAACGIRTARRGRGAEDLCRGAIPGVRGALHHHAQYAARRADRAAPVRIRDAGNRPGRVLEHDVRHLFPDDVARRGPIGLNAVAVPKSPRTGD